MFGLFKKKPILTDDDINFQVQTFTWLLTEFGGEDFYQRTNLILPSKKYFPEEYSSPQQAIEGTFRKVREYCNMSDWDCRLEPHEEAIDANVDETIALQNVPSTPHGTFRYDEESKEVIISYEPNIYSDPNQMIATFAHELAHYLTATTSTEPPGGWENWEFATDIAAIFLGFGVFIGNGAFNFNQFNNTGSQGWSFQGSGYLSQSEIMFSLAIFLRLKEISPTECKPYLKKNLYNLLLLSLESIDKLNLSKQLKQVKFNPNRETDSLTEQTL